MTSFDSHAARSRIEKFWDLKAEFGHEHAAVHIYLSEIVSDRYILVNGLQLLHDELQLAGLDDTHHHGDDVVACGVDLAIPTVLTTLAHTNCGDRIHQGEATTSYEQIVGTRFACMSEIGELKLEAFSPTGGGTDDGNTLAHVTVAHAMDASLHRRLYLGNPSSYVLVNIDLKTHVGRLEHDKQFMIGQTRESKWREPRAACGAIVGALKAFNEANNVHRRIRDDLGEANFALLSKRGVQTAEGIEIGAAVGAAIVAIQGMHNTAEALTKELDARGVGHLTASTTVNRPHLDDTILYFARATVFGGEIKMQGFGTDASKFSGRVVRFHDDNRLLLSYDGCSVGDYPITTKTYEVAEGASLTDEIA